MKFEFDLRLLKFKFGVLYEICDMRLYEIEVYDVNSCGLKVYETRLHRVWGLIDLHSYWNVGEIHACLTCVLSTNFMNNMRSDL